MPHYKPATEQWQPMPPWPDQPWPPSLGPQANSYDWTRLYLGAHAGYGGGSLGGAAINGLSKPHRDFLAAAGLGLLIGDGALNYRNETILETFYAYSINKSVTLTFDYQFIANPAYNADRGQGKLRRQIS